LSTSVAAAVNSWNEWDPLREVIVGSVRGAADMGYEPALAPYFAPSDPARTFTGGPVHPAVIDEAERQLDGLASLLEGLGVTVRRPDPVDHVQPLVTPDWSVAVGRVNACPRDVLLVVGDQIIEATMAQRARSFEFRAYRSLMKAYFRAGARWVAAPRPLLDDALFAERGEDEFDFNAGPSLTESEPVFDAASFARFGRDLFWQPDMVSNQFGADWLARQLGPGFRIHRTAFREKTPMHVDTTLVPIRPGLVLSNPARPVLDDGLRLFRENGWQVVEAPPSARSGRTAPGAVSNWISMNLLMLDPETAIVEAAETPMIELLRSMGCKVIPVPFDRVYAFGGGLHCATCDIRRDGGLQSYFPSLD
jgi:glycine amidinotransferase